MNEKKKKSKIKKSMKIEDEIRTRSDGSLTIIHRPHSIESSYINTILSIPAKMKHKI